jgi:hypothetical protein
VRTAFGAGLAAGERDDEGVSAGDLGRGLEEAARATGCAISGGAGETGAEGVYLGGGRDCIDGAGEVACDGAKEGEAEPKVMDMRLGGCSLDCGIGSSCRDSIEDARL